MRRYARTSLSVMAGVIALIAGSILGILAVRYVTPDESERARHKRNRRWFRREMRLSIRNRDYRSLVLKRFTVTR